LAWVYEIETGVGKRGTSGENKQCRFREGPADSKKKKNWVQNLLTKDIMGDFFGYQVGTNAKKSLPKNSLKPYGKEHKEKDQWTDKRPGFFITTAFGGNLSVGWEV